MRKGLNIQLNTNSQYNLKFNNNEFFQQQLRSILKDSEEQVFGRIKFNYDK